MKLSDLRRKISSELIECSGEDSLFEADCILCEILALPLSSIHLYPDMIVSHEDIEKAFGFVAARQNRIPLQYLLKKWEFYGLEFNVGEGVLIPRPETELLVDIAVNTLREKENCVCYDLCSGSGCIGISVAVNLPLSRVYMVEKSVEALHYLRENIALNSCRNTEFIQGDIITDCFDSLEKADVILSNPPYIRSAEIESLQHEVRNEPRMALDGGEDGLVFYRVLAEKWSSYLKDDGMMAVEIGEDQGEQVRELFARYFKDVNVIKDYSGLDRIVTAKEKI